MTDLKPCPFCGSEAKISKETHHYWDMHHWVIECSRCECMLWAEDLSEKDLAEVVSRWNTRTINLNEDEIGEPLPYVDVTGDWLEILLEAGKKLEEGIKKIQEQKAQAGHQNKLTDK